MEMKWIGALLIVIGCGGFGFAAASVHNREIHSIRQLLAAIEYMECELQYNLPSLPVLCRQASHVCIGELRKLFAVFADELENQISADAPSCMLAAMEKCCDLPPQTKACILQFGQSIGVFDLQGQLRSLAYTRQMCENKLNHLENNKEVRLRSYRTLGLCAGAALAILLL